MENQIKIGGLTLHGERMGAHIHVTVLGVGPAGHRPLCGTIRVIEAEWKAIKHAADMLEATRMMLGSWDYAGLAEDAHCTDYQGALQAVARVEALHQAARGEPGRQAGEG